MEIEIKNIPGALNVCESILKHTNEINQQIDELDSIIRDINGKWESSGQDKESYMIELTTQVNNLTLISRQISNFTNEIKNYVKTVQETSKKTM